MRLCTRLFLNAIIPYLTLNEIGGLCSSLGDFIEDDKKGDNADAAAEGMDVHKELAKLSHAIEQLPDDTKWTTISSLVDSLTPQKRSDLLSVIDE